MRKLGALALAIPVLVAVYVATLLRRSVAGRMAGAIVVGSVAGILVLAGLAPAPSTATPASTPRVPVAADFTSSVRTGHPLVDPIQVAFTAPMDAASVAASVRINPTVSFTMAWSHDNSLLTIQPVGHWAPDTLYTVSVAGGAQGRDGAALPAPVRTVFLTAEGGFGSVAATRASGDRVALTTGFTIALDRAVDVAVAHRALRTEPILDGTLTVVDAADRSQVLTFQPSTPLAADATYRLWFEGLVDADGVAFTGTPSLTVRTAPAPTVVRFRPKTGSTNVERAAAVSVRFTEPMERGSTSRSFRVLADGTEVAGSISWAEGDTVLVFAPAEPFPYAAAVTASVDATARSKAGATVTPTTGSFTVKPKPVVKPKPKPTPQPIPRTSGGTGAVSGSWTAVESYYLKLMNCTRTGGLVTSDGSCSSPGGRNVAALKLDAGISSKVARPYAKLLATRNLCSHFVGGNPGDRLRRAGYTSYRWAENLGCRSGNPYSAVLNSHLYFQSERNWSPVGGHYRNMMNAAFDRTGIGVWVDGTRVRLVVVFYHP